MRLIDADKLIGELKSMKIQAGTDFDEMRNFAVMTIEDAPTYDEKTELHNQVIMFPLTKERKRKWFRRRYEHKSMR